jgi:1,4-dihydroxy-2-naphthoate octaprenyltransferase
MRARHSDVQRDKMVIIKKRPLEFAAAKKFSEAPMNFAMWKKALNIIPNVSKEEWDQLDIISKWLISTRAAVLVMTFISAALAGLFAWRVGSFSFVAWLALTLGLILAHASNNIFNDYTDFVRGVDKDNYFRTIYGAQPIASGLMTKRQHLTYFAVTGLLALACGLYLIFINVGDPLIWILLALGAFFVLFYTWPLKYIALGEVAVLVVWGPLMIGGGYYVLTHNWDWNVTIASLPYVLGVTTVIFGKHIDKRQIDKEKRIYTLPVLIGEKAARYSVLAMMILPYIFTVYLIAVRFFTPIMLIVFFAIPTLRQLLPAFQKPKPETRPADFPEGQGGWPLYFAPMAFLNNRKFGSLFMLGVLADVLLRIFLPAFWR